METVVIEKARARLRNGDLAWLAPDELVQAHQDGALAAVYKVAAPTTPAEDRILDDRRGKATITSLVVDRSGDIIDPAGIDFDGYLKNPVVLMNHDRFMPIGRAEQLVRTRNGDKVVATWKFAPADVSPDAEWVWRLWRDGYINATSVGIIPRTIVRAEDVDGEYRGLKFTGIAYTESELVEFSVVTLPMNREALRVDESVTRYWCSVAKAFGNDASVWGPLIRGTIDPPIGENGADEVFTPVPVRGSDKGELIERPYPNEHACRLRNPEEFQPESFRRVEREHEGKKYAVIMGKLKGKTTMTEQAYRYPKDTWETTEARKHCQDHGGIAFEPASDESMSITDIRLAWVAGVISAEEALNRIEKAVADLEAARALAEAEARRWKRECSELAARIIVARRR